MVIGWENDNWRYSKEGIWILRRLSRLPLIEPTAGQILTAVSMPLRNRLAPHPAGGLRPATKVSSPGWE